MDEKLILESWERTKLSARNFYRLEDVISVEYGFRGQFGHPSSNAFVGFECGSADQLVFRSTALWPQKLSSDYIANIEGAICEAIVDSLLSVSFHPYRGCSLNLTSVKWDDIGSSEVAFYKATLGAMNILIENGRWVIEIINPPNLLANVNP
jgi:hypothetical protein